MQLARRAGHLCVWQLSPRIFVGLAVLAGSAWSQTSSSSFSFPGLPSRFSVCDSGEKTVAPGRLSFKQQVCWYANNLAAPSLFLHAGFSSAIGQWHNENYGKEDGLSYAQRFGAFYARHSARDAAELIAGYLNHEDPRPHTSGESSIWRRTKAALLSVLVLKTNEGSRPALTPIAGAFGSALVGSTISGRALAREASFSYGSAFGTAVYQEFKPDISSLARHALHRQTK